MALNLEQVRQALDGDSNQEGPDTKSQYRDLVQGNFHAAGFVPPAQTLMLAMQDYLAQRRYQPESKGLLAARQAIAQFYKDGGPVSPGCRVAIDPENILITASCSESYHLLFSVLTKPGDNVLLPQPGYPLFDDLADYSSLETRYYPLNAHKNWEIDCDLVDVLIDRRTKFLVLISPNNPCGSLVSEKTLKNLLKICKREKVMIICDEVFSEFIYGNAAKKLPRPAAYSPGVPVFTLNGVSKLFASPDLKLAWIALSYGQPGQKPALGFPDQEDMISALELRNDTFLNANSFVQFALVRFFADYGDFVRSLLVSLSSNREHLIKIKPGHSCGWTFHAPQAGIHVVLTLGGQYLRLSHINSQASSESDGIPEDEKLAIFLLKKHKLSLHPAWYYGYFSDSDDAEEDRHLSLVISLLAPREEYGELLRSLDAGLIDYCKNLYCISSEKSLPT